MITRHLKTTLAIFIASFAMLMAVLVITPQVSAQGGGGVGGGGTPGGCTNCGGSSTDYGYGWYRFSSAVGAEAPASMRDGDSWTRVRDFCRGTGNDSVIAFLIQTSGRTPSTANVYKYIAPDFNKYYDYKGDDGGNWLTHEYANALFNNLPASAKVGWYWGNNVAWFCYNFSKNWNIRAESYIQKGATTGTGLSQGTITAGPGDRLSWYHDLRNVGPDDMDKQIYFNIDRTGFTNGWNTRKDPVGYASGVYNQLFVRVYATLGHPYTLYDVTQNDVGNTLCARISWNPGSSSNAGWFSSGFACAAVPYNYSLIPTITNISDGDPILNGGGPFDVTGRVTNNGPTKSEPSVNYQVTEVRFAPGATLTNKPGGTSASNPCAYFTGNIACRSLQGGTQASGYPYPNNNTYTGSSNVDDMRVGTRVCYAMSVTKYAASTGGWRHSQLYCLTVIKQPNVHVTGGDLFVGRGSATNAPRISEVTTANPAIEGGRYYGSWAEYAVVPSGIVTRMASGSGYVGGATSKDLCNLSILTFTNMRRSATGVNTCTTTTIGGYVHGSSTVPNVANRFKIDATTPRLSSSSGPAVNIANLNGLYTTNDTTLSISSSAPIGEVSPGIGRSIIINAPNATVNITGSINYSTAPITAVRGIPQVLIIAKNIVISNAATKVDSWLVAVGSDNTATGVQGGVINTCGDVANVNQLRSTNCNNKLVVNGPIIANHLLMRRTFAGTTAANIGEAAETFNLRADAYIWAASYAPGTGRLPTVNVKELPPRF